MLARPASRSRFRDARFVRISFARWSASMRWTRERSGAAVVGLAGVFVAGGMGGESTALGASDKASGRNIIPPELEVQCFRVGSNATRAFAGLFLDDGSGVDRPSSARGPAVPV